MKTLARIRFLPVLALALAAGCDDLGVDSGGGAVTSLTIDDLNGATLVTVSPSGSVSGSLSVPRNGQRSIRIVLQGPAGIVTPGIAESIRVNVTNSTLVSWSSTGTSTGTLIGGGAGAGNTFMRVDLISGGTSEYTSPGITIQVT